MTRLHGRSLAVAVTVALALILWAYLEPHLAFLDPLWAYLEPRKVPATFHVGDPRDPLPLGWNSEQFLDMIRRIVQHDARDQDLGHAERSTTRLDVDLLAWKLGTHRGGLDYALAWVRVETAGQDRWTLVWMVRGEQFRWYPFYQQHDEVGVRPFVSFDHPPRNAEIYAFVDTAPPYEDRFFDRGADESVITYGGREDFRKVEVGQAAVREHTWKAIVGEAPIRTFNFEEVNRGP